MARARFMLAGMLGCGTLLSACSLTLDFDSAVPCDEASDCTRDGDRCYLGRCAAPTDVARCGDFEVEDDEECDDGRADQGDVCDATCQWLRCEGDIVVGATAAHCGACGHECLDGPCEDFECQPLQLLEGSEVGTRPWSIALYGGRVYWTDVGNFSLDGMVARVGLDGDGREVLHTGQNDPFDIALDALHVYWVGNASPGTLRRSGHDGGGLETLDADLASPTTMVMGTSQVYWLQESSSGSVPVLAVYDKGSGDIYSAAVLGAQGRGIARVSSGIYWGEENGEIRFLEFGGVDPPATVITGQTGLGKIAVDDTHIYWSLSGTLAQDFADGALRRAERDGDGLETLATARGPFHLTLDATHVYWLDADGLWRVAKDGSERAKLASEPGADLALDADHVYWLSDNGLFKVSKLARAVPDGGVGD